MGGETQNILCKPKLQGCGPRSDSDVGGGIEQVGYEGMGVGKDLTIIDQCRSR